MAVTTLSTTIQSFRFLLMPVILAGLFVVQSPGDEGQRPASEAEQLAELQREYDRQVLPFLQRYCAGCHGEEAMEAGVRVDQLGGQFEDHTVRRWRGILHQLAERTMPPEDELQPSEVELKVVTDWIERGLTFSRTRRREKHGTVRRLTVSQLQNTLHDLLGLDDHLTKILPPDAVSRDGFVNNEQILHLDPLLLEAYLEIAEEALNRCIVDPGEKPEIQHFRVDLGRGINSDPFPEQLILGANSHLLRNEDFVIVEDPANKPFEFIPWRMRTDYRFIEGYQGNDTVRGWREYDSIYHSVFACMRGSEGYPKGTAYETVPGGLLLRPAIPSEEIFDVESTYGPKANFKISLRELPEQGRFRVVVKAARYDDALLLVAGSAQAADHSGSVSSNESLAETQTIEISEAGLYQVDVHGSHEGMKARQVLRLQLGERSFSAVWEQAAFLVVRLPKGPIQVKAVLERPVVPNLGRPKVDETPVDQSALERVVFTPVEAGSELAVRYERFSRRSPWVGVHLGLRRDCGSTLNQVGEPQVVTGSELTDYIFEGEISNFPSPNVEKENVNYLAGIREIGVRHEYTDGRDRPRLLIHSVEFEGPYYDTWPPESHRRIFIGSAAVHRPAEYAREILSDFAARAYRRPVSVEELETLFNVWEKSYGEHGEFRRAIQETLTVVLTSPQFLFLVEKSASPEPELIDSWELASKLSYFLWDTSPDQVLLDKAAAGTLRSSLDEEVTRMINDPRFDQFIDEFSTQWFSLDKLDVVETDRKRFPELTRDTKAQLRQEPGELLKYLIRENRPLRELIDSETIVANEVVASYYGLGERTESGFEFVPVLREGKLLGGVLTQAGILAGLSDGREANAVKRGAWFARKIVAQPPDDPPPNVPALDKDLSHLSLRERLEAHRNQKGCVKCHSGIDPWGLPFEEFDAGGLLQREARVEARSTLPDGTEVDGVDELKAYLVKDSLDQVAFSVLKHLATYAVGRTLDENEIEFLKQEGLRLRIRDYRFQELVRFVIQSDIFQMK